MPPRINPSRAGQQNADEASSNGGSVCEPAGDGGPKRPWLRHLKTSGFAGLSSLVVFVALGWISIHMARADRQRARAEAEATTRDRLAHVSREVLGELEAALVELSAMADWVSIQDHVDPAQFVVLSERALIRRPSLLSTTLLPDDVIRLSHPQNPGLIGLDVGAHPIQGKAVAAMRRSGRPVVTGPIDLVQGGRGLILRAPVWSAQNDRYFGHVSMVFGLEQFEATLKRFAKSYDLRLRVSDSNGAGHTQRLTIPAAKSTDAAKPSMTIPLSIAQEQWNLSAWPNASDPVAAVSPQLVLSLVLSMLAAAGVFLLLHSYRRLRMRNKQLSTAREAAEVSSDAKSTFVASVSHELRTPMNGIIATAELLLATDLSAEQRELATVLTDASRGLLGLINQVLDFSKLDAGKMEPERLPTSPRKLLAELQALLSREAEKHFSFLTVECDGEVPDYLSLDPSRVRQVLLNLTTNALKFGEQGPVEVRCRYAAEDSRVRFSVRDHGIGIKDTSVLFGDFVQADTSTARKYGGTGLGLAICKRLVKLMGGEIGVDSQLGAGSEFWFELPAPLTRPMSSARPPESLSPVRPGVALVVDDNKVNRLVAQRVLARFGWTADLVNNGEDAIRAATGKRYAIIFMDCEMPIMDGYEATRRLRSSGCQTPIIAMTAHTTAESREACLDAGMSDYLSKPIQMESIHAMLRCWHSVRASDAGPPGLPADSKAKRPQESPSTGR